FAFRCSLRIFPPVQSLSSRARTSVRVEGFAVQHCVKTASSGGKTPSPALLPENHRLAQNLAASRRKQTTYLILLIPKHLRSALGRGDSPSAIAWYPPPPALLI